MKNRRCRTVPGDSQGKIIGQGPIIDKGTHTGTRTQPRTRLFSLRLYT